MKTGSIYAAILAITLLAAATGESLAWFKNGFAGTRDQVRAACTKVGGSLEEGAGYSTCSNDKNGTTVSCDDSNNCAGSGQGPAPRVRLGTLDIVGFVTGYARPRAPEGVPESLTSSGSDSPAATGGSAGAPAGGGVVIYGNGGWHNNGGAIL